jgi:hypothetical protein
MSKKERVPNMACGGTVLCVLFLLHILLNMGLIFSWVYIPHYAIHYLALKGIKALLLFLEDFSMNLSQLKDLLSESGILSP